MFSIWEWFVIALVVILLFGVKRIPGLGRSLGEAIRNFRKGLKETPEKEDKQTKEVGPTSKEHLED